MAEEVQIRYVEVPKIEWKEVIVPKKEVIELTRRVPKVEIVEIEKVVEVPEVHEVAREVEVIHSEDIIRHVPRKEIINIPVEVIKQVPKPETIVREHVVQVPGEIIEVPRPYVVENRIPIPSFRDKRVPTVVAQTARPHFRPLGTHEVPVIAKDCDPVLIKVVVPVIKPVRTPVWQGSRIDEHNYVQVPPTEYNTLVRAVNQHLPTEYYQDLYVTDSAGVPIPPISDMPVIVPPLGTVKGTPPPPPHTTVIPPTQGAQVTSRDVLPGRRPWMPPSALLYGPWSKEDERYYREHHQWFHPDVQQARSPQSAPARTNAARKKQTSKRHAPRRSGSHA